MNLKRQNPATAGTVYGAGNNFNLKRTIDQISPRVKFAVNFFADVAVLMTIAMLFILAMHAL